MQYPTEAQIQKARDNHDALLSAQVCQQANDLVERVEAMSFAELINTVDITDLHAALPEKQRKVIEASYRATVVQALAEAGE